MPANVSDAQGYPRGLERRLHQLLDEEPVVLVSGPRSVGKSYTSERVVKSQRGTILRLDDPSERRLAAGDPVGYLQRRSHPVLIDEYQHVPELLGAIKADLSRRGTAPGQYLLTGSVRADLAGATEWLTGRVLRTRLRSLSQSELAGHPSTAFLDVALRSPAALRGWRDPDAPTTLDLLDRIVRGGFPLAVDRTASARRRWFDAYVRDTVLRDALDHANIRKPEEMLRLLRLLAARTAQELRPNSVQSDLELNRHTISGYLEILTGLFLIEAIPAWSTNRSQRAVKAPKYHVADTGIATSLLDIDVDGLRSDPTLSGHLLESFVVAEILKQAAWLDVAPAVHHFRERDGTEVDIVLERPDQAVVGVEVKLAAQVGGRDFKGLRRLRELVGARFVGGLVLAGVPGAYVTDDDLVVAPVSALWARDLVDVGA